MNGSEVENRMRISDNNYILDFIVNEEKKSTNETITVNYIVSVEDDEAYKETCQIKLTFKTCCHTCETCTKDLTESNEEEHNCIKCTSNFYLSPEGNNNCYSISEKKANWYLNSSDSNFGICHNECESCSGPKEDECTSCKNELYLENGKCKNNCSQEYFSNSNFVCIKCYKSCLTCKYEGNIQKMNCETCKENHIKYKDNCYEIYDQSKKIFNDPESGNQNSCYEKFTAYIKEDSSECIPFPNEEEGYYISNNQTGLLSKCHDNCLSCNQGPMNDSSGNIISMECKICKNFNNQSNNMIKNENNCFEIVQYEESKIYFKNLNNSLGTCYDFGKAIYYGKYECIDKPNNSYFIINIENTGVIKKCHEACKTCFGGGNNTNTNCIECSEGYFKDKESDSDTNCVRNESSFTDDNQCSSESLDKDKTIEELKTKIKNDISSYIS